MFFLRSIAEKGPTTEEKVLAIEASLATYEAKISGLGRGSWPQHVRKMMTMRGMRVKIDDLSDDDDVDDHDGECGEYDDDNNQDHDRDEHDGEIGKYDEDKEKVIMIILMIMMMVMIMMVTIVKYDDDD